MTPDLTKLSDDITRTHSRMTLLADSMAQLDRIDKVMLDEAKADIAAGVGTLNFLLEALGCDQVEGYP